MTIRTNTLAILLAFASATGVWAQDVGPGSAPATNTPLPTTLAVLGPDAVEKKLPPPIQGCEDYVDSCSAGSGRAGSASGSGAFISQIGDGNQATIAQRRGSTASAARITQNGEDNIASIEQDGVSSFADIAQDGIANGASISQGGEAHSTASASQTGFGNQVSISQSAAFIEHAAVTRQNGNRNVINLTQSGDGNSAMLTQEGDDNSMSVSQSGMNNALTWVQTGSGLGGPSVSMDGNDRALTIMQYNMFAPK